MKAALFYGDREIRVEEVDMPHLERGDMLLKVLACSICSSDIREYVTRPRIKDPVILGHEFVADVVEASPESVVLVDSRVTVKPGIACGRCYYCKRSMPNLCEHYGGLGWTEDGALAEYIRVPASIVMSGGVLQISEDIPIEHACLTEPLACCLHAHQLAEIRLGSSVVIIGAGPIGLLHVQLAKHQGALVIVSELITERLSMARQLGADYLIDPRSSDFAQMVKDVTDGIGADTVMVAVGSSEAAIQALSVVRKRGTVILFGGFPHGSSLEVDPNAIHYKEILLTGSTDSTPATFEEAFSLIRECKIDAAPLISGTMALDQAQEAFEKAATKKYNRIIITA